MTFSSDEEIKLRISEHQAKAGRVGGQSRSPEKRKAVAENLRKARAKRWPGRSVGEAAALASTLLEGINVNRSEKEPLSSTGSRKEPQRGGCGPSFYQPDCLSDQPGNGRSNGVGNERVSGELFGFVFEDGIPKGWRSTD